MIVLYMGHIPFLICEVNQAKLAQSVCDFKLRIKIKQCRNKTKEYEQIVHFDLSVER